MGVVMFDRVVNFVVYYFFTALGVLMMYKYMELYFDVIF